MPTPAHDARFYGKPFMFRPDEISRLKLQEFIEHFVVSNAPVIRQLLAQAQPEDFPPSWQMKAVERPQAGRDDRAIDQKVKL
jgi:hypothetical protein